MADSKSTSGKSDGALYASVAVECINPPLGCPMGGYWQRQGGVTSIHDNIHVRVVLFSDAADARSNVICIVAFDLVGLHRNTVDEMKTRMRQQQPQLPLSDEKIIILCNHIHTGPQTHTGFIGMGHAPDSYIELLYSKVSSAVTKAAESLKPAELLYHRVDDLNLAVNRRERINPEKENQTNVRWFKIGGLTKIGRRLDGPYIPYAHVINIREIVPNDVKPRSVGILFSYPCHPVARGLTTEIGTDFLYKAVEVIESEWQAPAIFMNGACGDVAPRIETSIECRTQSDADKLGIELGTAVINVLKNSTASAKQQKCKTSQMLASVLVDVELPLQAVSLDSAILFKKEQETWLEDELKKGTPDSGLIVPRACLDYAERLCEYIQSGNVQSSLPFKIHAIRIGEIVLVGTEGEMFSEYQLRCEKSSPFHPTIFCGYANGCVGYVPTADEYPFGGYEVLHAYKVYGQFQMIAPESEDVINRNIDKVLQELQVQSF